MEEDYQKKPTLNFRTRKVLSLFPFIVVNGLNGDFIWTGKWFKWVSITEQLYLERYLMFDDGWSYEHYWSSWKEDWKFIRLNKN